MSRCAAFAVERLDAAAQLGDRRDQVVAILDHQVELFAHLLGFLLGAEVDPAQPLALGLQPIDLRLDLRFLRQRVLGPDPGRLRRLRRIDVERLVHLPLDLVPLRDEALDALFDAR